MVAYYLGNTLYNKIDNLDVLIIFFIKIYFFRAAVMEQNLWFRNDEGLTLKLCENKDLESTSTYEKCCSCNEAKYEVDIQFLIYSAMFNEYGTRIDNL